MLFSHGLIAGKTFKKIISLATIIILLLLPAFYDAFADFKTASLLETFRKIFFSLLLFLIPLVIFYSNVRLYFYLLLIWIILSPVFIFSITYFEVRPRFELIALALQTNAKEIKEISSGYLTVFIPVTILYVLAYLAAVYNLIVKRISFKVALVISAASALILTSYLWHERKLYNTDKYNLLSPYYPASVLSGIAEAYSFIKKNNLDASKNFSFKAYKKDTIKQRQIYVFVIGEASRYNRWQVNGYSKPTSPHLAARENLITYPNVSSGCNLTWMSVPQMITRANPDHIDLQFKEKSILSAYKEAGFKTVWLSNQSDREIFWSGTIVLHAKTADVALFSPSNTPNFETENYYDERMLPIMDSIIKSDTGNIFFVVHTMGNHWDYSSRYPQSFDYFKPSGYTQSINPPAKENKEAISNSYDNSVRYADHFIDSLITIVNKYQAISTVTFLSDHGEDLFDKNADQIDFHLNCSRTTIHVPLFIWTSGAYKQAFPSKALNLLSNRSKKIGSVNTFYSLLDISNISFHGFDSTKSIANDSFIENEQRYYDNTERRAFYYKDLPLENGQ